MNARKALDMALVSMAAEGSRPRCAEGTDRNWWTSENADERAHAARLCGKCPAYSECAAVAEEEQPVWGVWAGVDYSNRRRRKEK